MKVPHTTPGVWPADIPPSRFASLVRRDSAKGCAIGLIGLADDLGVTLNGGRPGAREGPRAFREALSRYGVADPHKWEWERVFDAGDIVPAEGRDEAALHETHRRVSEATHAVLDLGLLPVGVGGGHDLTFPLVRAVAERAKAEKKGAVEGVYYDAHLDVRETAGSGMAFRKLVEDCGVGPLLVRCLNPLVNSAEHVRWFLDHGGTIAPAGMLMPAFEASKRDARMFVSFDLDVMDAAYAPGVSAPNPCGASSSFAAAHVLHAGMTPHVRCFDIMELNPLHDPDGRTARLAAYLFLTFLLGHGRRARAGSKGEAWDWP